MLIGIHGKSGHGKDTIADHICRLDPRFEVRKFATGVRKAAAIITDIPWDHMLTAEEKAFSLSELKWDTSQFDTRLRNSIEWATERSATPLEVARFKAALKITHDQNEFIRLDYSVGTLLQLLGTDCFRDIIDEDIWVNELFRNYKQCEFVVISDVRAPNEEQRIHECSGIVIRVTRPECGQLADGRSSAHASENWVVNCDYGFDNSGSLQDLLDMTEKFVKSQIDR